jgi:dihydroorotate dehydrogenase electron transfer subunit
LSRAANRSTIFLEEAPIISHRAYPGEQYVLRVRAPRCAGRADPGSFAHLTCDPLLPMRRPLSIMRADRGEGWLEFLYKPIGEGLARLATRQPGETLSLLGPIGRGFAPMEGRPVVLALAGGVGIPPVFFLAERMHARADRSLVVLMGSEVPFPFELGRPGRELTGMPAEASLAVAQLEHWGVPSRLASNAGMQGCYRGHVAALARHWLESLSEDARTRVQVVGCGPHAMLEATARLAQEFELPCQIAVEEFMACGVGGCAGCIVPLHTPGGLMMKRVCVDGPVFDGRELFPPR